MIIDSQTFLARGQFVDLPGGLRTHYIDIPGRDIAAKTVIFVHGSGPGASGWSNFHANLQQFADAGHRVVVYDLPGYGETTNPQMRCIPSIISSIICATTGSPDN